MPPEMRWRVMHPRSGAGRTGSPEIHDPDRARITGIGHGHTHAGEHLGHYTACPVTNPRTNPRRRWARAPATEEDEVEVVGARRASWRDFYHLFLHARWLVALGAIVLGYLGLNACFALAY